MDFFNITLNKCLAFSVYSGLIKENNFFYHYYLRNRFERENFTYFIANKKDTYLYDYGTYTLNLIEKRKVFLFSSKLLKLVSNFFSYFYGTEEENISKHLYVHKMKQRLLKKKNCHLFMSFHVICYRLFF